MYKIIFALGTAFLLSLAITPIMIRISKKEKIYDVPDGRKKHKKPTPLMGGIAIYFATIISTILSVFLFSTALQYSFVIAFLIGISAVTLMGLIDDIMALSAKWRLIILFFLAINVMIGCLSFYFGGRLLDNGILSMIFMSVFVVVWIVAITNAINFTDGMDGLAGCLSMISVASFAIIFHFQGRTELALPTVLALIGAIAGFLPYNLSPAKIFMGDAGSMFIGFMLGIFSIMSMSQQPLLFCVVPIFFILEPIMEMYTSILRRLIMKTPIMKPDSMHLHHRLNARFKNNKLVVLILSLLQLSFSGIGVIVYIYKVYLFGWIMLALLIAVFSIRTYFYAKKLKKEIPLET